MSPNFWGCRCCGKDLVATVDEDGNIYVRNIRNGNISWTYHGIGTGARSIKFVSRDRVAVTTGLKLWIVEKNGINGTVIYEERDTFSRSALNDTSLHTRDGQIGAYSYGGGYRPYIRDSDGVIVREWEDFDDFANNPFVSVQSCAIHPSGDLYILASPRLSAGYSTGIWRLKADGTIGEEFDTASSNTAGGAIYVSDDERIFCGYVNASGQHVAEFSDDLVPQWTLDGSTAGGLIVRRTTWTRYGRESGTVIREREFETGVLVSEYEGFWIDTLRIFVPEEKSGHLIGGGLYDAGIIRVDPESDEVVWEGYVNSRMVSIDTWYD